jgi:tight adherence protein C
MMNLRFVLMISTSAAVALAVYAATRLLNGGGRMNLRSRLRSDTAKPAVANQNTHVISSLLQQVGEVAAKPFMPTTRQRQSALRCNLARGGIYVPWAPRLLVGCRLIGLLGGCAAGYALDLALNTGLLWTPLLGLGGYLAPWFWLRRQIRNNQTALVHALPDALDLMVVCIEAGLTIDAAMQRVGQELALAHPRISRELGIAHMETRVGLSRAEALKNLGVRTGCAAIQSMVAMLAQAERFGTSIAAALRVHAEGLRVARQQAAEELGAKASVKLTFPLVLFIFPATFIVLAGPTVIGLLNSPLFTN